MCIKKTLSRVEKKVLRDTLAFCMLGPFTTPIIALRGRYTTGNSFLRNSIFLCVVTISRLRIIFFLQVEILLRCSVLGVSITEFSNFISSIKNLQHFQMFSLKVLKCTSDIRCPKRWCI